MSDDGATSVTRWAPPPEPPGLATPDISFTAELIREVEGLRALLGPPELALIALVIAGAWLLVRGIDTLTRALPLPPLAQRRARLASTSARVAVWLAVGAWLAGHAIEVAPAITATVLGMFTAVVVFGLREQVADLIAGIGLALRGRVKEGDQIAVGELRGMVRRLGLMRTELRSSAGSTLLVPNRALSAAPIDVGRVRNSFPLRVALPLPGGLASPAQLERARTIATLSPYRDAGSRVDVRVDGERLLVEFQVWAARLLPAAEQHLRALLARHVVGPARATSSGRDSEADAEPARLDAGARIPSGARASAQASAAPSAADSTSGASVAARTGGAAGLSDPLMPPRGDAGAGVPAASDSSQWRRSYRRLAAPGRGGEAGVPGDDEGEGAEPPLNFDGLDDFDIRR